MPRILAQALAGLQFLLPHHLLTGLAHRIAKCRIPWFKNTLIRGFSKLFGINWEEAAADDPSEFEHFNAFFTRALLHGVRPVTDNPLAIISPCDGTLSAFGAIQDSQIFQAKGQDYSLHSLLAEDAAASLFRNGEFATIYLSPRDYHRIHMPVAAELLSMIHVPGRLFSVAPYTVQCISGLFARNERSIHLFNSDSGPMALALIGAMIVGSMQTVWHGVLNPPRARQQKVWHYPEQSNGEPISLDRAAEMGRFNMGSTVIMLFPEHSLKWETGLYPGCSVRMGQPLARHQPH
nr:putative phosphatidylserine decarboxylase [uncultured bacterium]